jgi:antitoxin component HigA of HigAB toxin-antitoxin module
MNMEIKPIKNNHDYREALKEIDQLMEARPNTVEGCSREKSSQSLKFNN